MKPAFQSEFLSLAFWYLACRWKVMGHGWSKIRAGGFEFFVTRDGSIIGSEMFLMIEEGAKINA